MTSKTDNNRLPAVIRQPVQDTAVAVMDTGRFEHLQRIATVISSGTLTPKHLIVAGNREGTLANCFRGANQAIRWGCDPFAVADESYVVHGRLGYQGKLVAAIINTRAGLVGRLSHSFAGSGADLTVTVSGRFPSEPEARTVTLSVRQAKTENRMWTEDPRQKLVYSGSIRWARRHCPEVVMGVLTDDDLERIREREEDATPATPAPPRSLADLTARLEAPAEPTQPIEVVMPEEAAAKDAGAAVIDQTTADPIESCRVGNGVDLQTVSDLLATIDQIGQCAAVARNLLPSCEDAGQAEAVTRLVEMRQEEIRASKRT